MSSAYWIRLGGTTAATEIAPHTPPTWETWADGGNGSASFNFGRSAKHEPHLTKPGTLMEIMLGCGRVWMGRVEDYDPNEGAVVGRGIHTDMLSVPALDGLGAMTRNVATAFATAIAAPWNLIIRDPNGVAALTPDAYGDSTEPLMLAKLLDQCAQQAGKRWGQDQNGAFYVLGDGVAASWLLAPGVARFGDTTEGQASHLVGRYIAVGGAYATVTRSDADATVIRAELVDLTERGEMSVGDVQATLDAALDAGKSSRGWVTGATVSREQLMTVGGTPAMLAGVRGGQRLNIAEIGPDMSAIIGKTRYTAGEETIYIEPANTAPRTLVDVLAAS